MKKLLLSSIVLMIFAISLTLFQLSCKKEAQAVTQSNTNPQGKIIYLKEFYGSGNTLYDHAEIWTANNDGSGQVKLNISLPTNVVIALVAPKVSGDGKTVFFDAFQTDGKQQTSGWNVYACNLDGSNAHQVVAASDVSVTIADTY